ncbi:MAG TPA: hypothetical protein DEP84_27130, partial [Chloroflexi bacterium]|nr:hypothetical protein [Chloroflexota bacterium]
MRQPPTLSDLLATSHSETFVGRERELAWFNYELERATPQRALWWLHGPPGVGKSALLHRWLLQARSLGYATAVYEGENPDPLAAMVNLATQLAAQGEPLELFEQNRQVYTSLWAAIRTDPEAPRGLLARRPPPAAGSLTRGLAEMDSLTPRDLATHLRRHHQWAPDQIALALEGTRLLTESFVAGLREVSLHEGLVIAFDEWERTGPWLERWLLSLLTTSAGRLPATIIWIVVSPEPQPDGWAPLAAATAVVTLTALTLAQIGQLAPHPSEQGTTAKDQTASEEIITKPPASGSPCPTPPLPLWIEPLVGIGPDECGTARLLDSLTDRREPAVLLAAAIPQRLNPTTLKSVLGSDEAPHADEWLNHLSHAPYSQTGGDVRLRPAVRTALLHYLRRENPLDEAEGHLALAAAALPAATRLYHRLMAR